MKKIKEITEARVHQDIVLYDGYADSWVLCHVEIAEDNLLVLHRVKGLLESDLPEDVISNKTKSDCKKIILRETDTHWIHYQLPSDSQDESVALFTTEGLSGCRMNISKPNFKETPMEKLNVEAMEKLKVRDLLVLENRDGCQIMVRVVGTPNMGVEANGVVIDAPVYLFGI